MDIFGSYGGFSRRGYTGYQGATGAQGFNGSQGATGSIGFQGFQGDAGSSNNATGPQGIVGSLAGASDTTISNPTGGYVLKYSASKWTSQSPDFELFNYSSVPIVSSASGSNGDLYILSSEDILRVINNGYTVENWSTLSETGFTKRWATQAFCINDVIYVCGGINVSGGGYSNANQAYNINTGVWTTKNTMSVGNRYYGCCFTYNGKGYIIGGQNGGGSSISSTVVEYDPVGDTWTTIATGGWTAVARGGWFRVGKYAYVVGGTTSSGLPVIDKIQRFDLELHTWTLMSTVLNRVTGACGCFVDGNTAYICGGYTTSGAVCYDFISYDTVLDSKTTLPDLTINVGNNTFCPIVHNDVYMLFANSTDSEVHRYKFSTQTWSTVPTLNLNDRAYANAVCDDSTQTRLFVIGGQQNGGIEEANFTALP